MLDQTYARGRRLGQPTSLVGFFAPRLVLCGMGCGASSRVHPPGHLEDPDLPPIPEEFANEMRSSRRACRLRLWIIACDVMFLATTVDTCYVVSTVCVGHCIAPSYAVCGMWAVFSSTCLAFSAAFRCVVCAVVRRTKNARSRPRVGTALATRHWRIIKSCISVFLGSLNPGAHTTVRDRQTKSLLRARVLHIQSPRALSDWTSHASQ